MLAEARALFRRRDFAALAQRLAPLERAALRAEPELGVLLADSWRRLGQPEDALALTRELADVCEQRGNDRIFRERLNLEGMLWFDRGEVARAAHAWSELLRLASEAGDAHFVARANHNLGVVSTLQGDSGAALASYERAITAYHQLGYLRGIAQSHENLAITYRELERLDQAEHHCLQAIEYARADGSEDEVARAQQERALVLCLAGDLALAQRTALQALHGFRRLNSPADVGGTLQVLGLIALAQHRHAEAATHLQDALTLARQTQELLLEAEILEAQAALAAAERDEPGCRWLQAEASRRFVELGAVAWGERARARLLRIRAAAPTEEEVA